jgi:hypothetical protein
MSSSLKKIEAQTRNHLILRLRGAASLCHHPLLVGKAGILLAVAIDLALRDLGAKSIEEHKKSYLP